MTEEPIEPIKVFFSYSRSDEKFKDELVKRLSILQRQGVISIWNDRLIEPGSEWEREIDTQLSTADIILLLVSPDFLDSDHCWIEIEKAMQRHATGEACVIPVVLRHVDWKDTPFAKLQALPKDARPIESWSNRDEAFYDVARGIKDAVEKLYKARQQQRQEAERQAEQAKREAEEQKQQEKLKRQAAKERQAELRRQADEEARLEAEALQRQEERKQSAELQRQVEERARLSAEVRRQQEERQQGAELRWQAVEQVLLKVEAICDGVGKIITLFLLTISLVLYWSGSALAPGVGGDSAGIDSEAVMRQILGLADESFLDRGNEKQSKGDNKGAIADYNQAIKLNPDDANAYYNRGLSYKEQGEKQLAIADFQKARDLFQQQKNSTGYQKALDRLKELQ